VPDWISSLARPLVFTNGCFDLLHRGHVSYLETSSRLGASLVVGLNSDDSVRRLGKDLDRPFNPLEDRMAVIAALASVDAVIAFDDDTPLELILTVHPDVLVKGGDWVVPDIVGGREVQGWGGTVHSIGIKFDRSTTDLINRIKG
jgi:rfaE bifunctional protein nucleotidyltransferase chain/domain